MQSKWSRVKIVGWAVVVVGGLAVLPALSVPRFAPELWASIMAGPFAGLWATATWGPADAGGWAVVCGLAIGAHPLRPNPLTGVVSVVGVVVWVFLGLVLTFDGV